jgi:Uma2 family endonuclease
VVQEEEGDIVFQRTEESSEQPTVEIADLFPHQGQWTERDYFGLPDTNRFVELSEGKLTILDMPTDSHQKASLKLLREIDSFVEDNALGEVRYAPLPVRLWHGKVREPDIVFMSDAHRDRISEDYWEVPDLAVEVISRSTEQVDRTEKFAEYAQAGIAEYWMVDTAERTIEVYVLERGYKLLGKWGVGEIARSKVLAGFAVPVESVV